MTLINLTQDTTGKMNKLSGTVTSDKVLVSTASDPDNISESSLTVGGVTQPIYLNAGTPTACSSYPTVNDASLTIQKNGTDVGTFTANASSNATANITVPTTASDVGALPSDTAFATMLSDKTRLEIIQSLMGHASINTTSRYIHRDINKLAQALSSIY